MRTVRINNPNELNNKFYGVIKHLYSKNKLPCINPPSKNKKIKWELVVVLKDKDIKGFVLLEEDHITALSVNGSLTKKEKKKVLELLYTETKK